MNHPDVVLTILLPLALVPVGTCQTRTTRFADCRVTIPRTSPGFVHDAIDIRNAYWSGDLYVGASWPDATVPIGPQGVGSILPDGSLRAKYAWFRAPGLTGKLAITGKRLNAGAERLPSAHS